MTSDRTLQALDAETLNLKANLQEKSDALDAANQRMKRAEAFALEAQAEANKVRSEAARVDQENVRASD